MTLKAKIHLHFKMTFFNDHFLIKKICLQTHYSIKKEILKKVFHFKHGLLRRTCCCCRCLYIRKEEENRKKRSTWVKACLRRRDALGFYNTVQLTTLYNIP